MVDIICPYKSNIRNTCVHRANGQKTTKKRKCGYEKIDNCPMYKLWLKERKYHHKPLKRRIGGTHKQDES